MSISYVHVHVYVHLCPFMAIFLSISASMSMHMPTLHGNEHRYGYLNGHGSGHVVLTKGILLRFGYLILVKKSLMYYLK